MTETISLTADELREGLRLLREMEHAHGQLHVAQADYERYVAHLGTLHQVPGGYGLRDWIIGFEPMKETNHD